MPPTQRPPRRPLRRLRGTCGLALAVLILACSNPFGEKIPTPWSETEGRQEVVGTPDGRGELPDDDVVVADGEARPSPLVQDPQVRVERPATPSDLPPVEGSYEHLFDTGSIASCPDGTELVDKRQDDRKRSLYCALEGDVRHGPWISFHNNGKVKEIAPYVAGQRHGQVTTWSRSGAKESTFTWVDGQPTTGETY